MSHRAPHMGSLYGGFWYFFGATHARNIDRLKGLGWMKVSRAYEMHAGPSELPVSLGCNKMLLICYLG